ncbi:MAG: bifunctional acetate--CoA ligase family protein/GNAT family N-acetyltransferase [Pseudorhodoplanes sp.]
MSVFGLNRAFEPKSLAVVGAGPDPSTLGGAVFANLRAAGFPGRIDTVNPRHSHIDGNPCFASVDRLETAPDLLVVATPARTIPEIMRQAIERRVGAAIVLSAGLGHGVGSLADEMHGIARAGGLRIIGPNCLGVLAPHAKLNASFAAVMPRPGQLAVISQSGAIAAAMAEWGSLRGIGFSAIVSLGDQVDVDLGDLLDYFALDRRTSAILLYVESINDARKFMSAARAASRTKPVVVIKSGRHAQGAKAAATHTGAMAGSDAVYDAAFRRAGLLRVYDMAELFASVETLACFRSLEGTRLAILTNGGGLGVLAVDSLVDRGHAPAELSPATIARLDRSMPPICSKSNPVDIVGDADAARYTEALQTLIEDKQNDAILVLNVQTALASSVDTAEAVRDVIANERSRFVRPKPVFTCWIGADEKVQAIFRSAQVPHYPTEVEAVRGFSHLARRSDLVRALMARPAAVSEDFTPYTEAARKAVDTAKRDGRTWLTPIETNAVLEAYGIPAAPLHKAEDAQEAVAVARKYIQSGQPVAVKILSADIPHKSDVDGVRLNLTTEADVEAATTSVIANAKRLKPQARIDGVTVQPMILRPRARELIAGLARDPTFGTVVLFGHGGIAVEAVDDKAIALPPLDLARADDLISRTRISRLLNAYRNVPTAKREEIALVLVRLSRLAADLPDILELDINPLLADDAGVVSLDARIAIDFEGESAPAGRYPHFAIRPYPKELERNVALPDGRVIFVRPVRPEDEPLYERFFEHVSTGDMRLRFFGAVKDTGHAFIARLTQIDYGRAMALLAIDHGTGELMGVVRLHVDPNGETGEYAILLRSDLKGRGLGWALMEQIIDYARNEGLKRIHGDVLAENTVMLKMCQQLGFDIRDDDGDRDVKVVTLNLS